MVWLVVFLVCAGLLGLLVAAPGLAKRESRSLPDEVVAEISAMPERRRAQHLVDLELRDGRVIKKVWVAWNRYPAFVGGRMITRHYDPRDVLHARQHDNT